jgi:micrococcal nuclease|tara:strand:- start:19 stop:435 length:417 start_codon:yes stop_codon:yes gene_type:complete
MYQYRAKIVKIIDGDTVDVDIDLGFSVILSKQRIRLYGIDTPESRTRNLDEKKYGLLAKNFLKEFIGKAGNHLIVETCKDDRGKFGRILGKLINKDNECVNTIMCSLGHAVEYYGQSKDDIAKSHLLNRIKIDKLNEQ